METRQVHVNCLKIVFDEKSKMPTDQEIFAFFRKKNWTSDMLNAMFREPREYSVYVMFKTDELMKRELVRCPAATPFQYDNGQVTTVTFAAARGNFKYVRIFGLPVEIDDKHVASAMSKYGKIQHLVRERYGVDTGYPILNGVRGVHIELSSEIPAQIFIQHFQAKVFYDGMRSKCFVCGSTEHMKSNCPKRTSVNDRLGVAGGRTYAQSVIGGPAAVSRLVIQERTETTAEEVVQTEETEKQHTAEEAHGECTQNIEDRDEPLDEPISLPETAGGSVDVEANDGKVEKDSKGKKRPKNKQKQPEISAGNSRSYSSTSGSDDTVPEVKKVLVTPANDLLAMQSSRSRSRQVKAKK